MRRTALISFVTAAAVVVASCTTAPPPAGAPAAESPAPQASAPQAPAWHAEMLAAINAERAADGKSPLSACGTLNVAAQAHSEDQAAHRNMSHTGSDGSNPGVRIERAGYLGWNAWGENVAWNQSDVAQVMYAWMNSSGHRANILSGSFTHVGVGRADSNGPYWTQVFGRGGSC